MQSSLLLFFIAAVLLCGSAPVCSGKGRAYRGRGAKGTFLPVRSGDVLFISVPNYLFRKVSAATRCRANHVGIVFNDAEQGWVVAESAVPLSRYTPLEEFIARSENGWFQIRRLKSGLTDAQVTALRRECDARMGILYHTGFRYESARLFCSKFVYDVYRSALGVEVGELETFSHLLKRNPAAGLAFWRVWYFGRIPWNRVTVTPASQFASRHLTDVVADFSSTKMMNRR